jgi:hypothetical protein
MKMIRNLSIVLTGILLAISLTVFADMPPNPGGGPGGGDDPVGGGSPVGGGLIILTIAASLYGARKTFRLNNKSKL